jgi:hypothetical protein
MASSEDQRLQLATEVQSFLAENLEELQHKYPTGIQDQSLRARRIHQDWPTLLYELRDTTDTGSLYSPSGSSSKESEVTEGVPEEALSEVSKTELFRY